MFQKKTSTDYISVAEKITMKTLVHGDKSLMCEFRMQKDAILPRHKHPHEQTGYLVSGKIQLTIGAESFSVAPGDSWSIQGDIEHQAEILEDSVAIEVFSPVRKDYLPQSSVK